MKRLKLSLALLTSISAGQGFAETLAAFDVAEDLTRFVYAETQRFEDDMPAYGNAFVTQGYIYPAGTLDGGVEGTKADGSPAFPDKVIGTWTCDGYFVGQGMRTESGTFVISRQVFQFNDGGLLITQGPELIDNGAPVSRAVTGGTGDYAEVGSEIVQVMLGMSDGYGTRLQMKLSEVSAASK
ncbi:MAG TPA: hypothetical protein PKA03_08905 [Tabrizicola sp.]|nr:hypothetical protein [Tabrizicola sp.]